MTLRWNSCEGPNGTTVTAANSDDVEGNAFDSVTTNGQTIAFTTSSPIRGSSSIRCASATAASSCFWQTNDTAASAVALRWYEKWTTWPSALQQNGFNIRGGGAGATTIGRRNINTNGTFSISLAATSGNSTTVLTTGSVFRFELVVTGLNGASGVMTLRVFSGHSKTALEQLQLTAQTTALTCDAIRWGKVNGAGTHDQMFDDLAWDIGRSTEIGPAIETINVVDTFTLTEGVSNISHQRTDAFTLSDLPASMVAAATALDTFTFTEAVTETVANDGVDYATLTEGAPSITVAATGAETFTQGDDTANSIPTGPQAVSWGGGLSNSYVVATDTDAADLTVGNKAMLYNGFGVLIENTVFTITGISAPFSGFVNVSISPAAATLPALGDTLKEVIPAGASLLQASNLTDSFTLSETAVVSQTLSGTDTLTLSDVASLTIATSLVGTDTQTLSEVAAVSDVQQKVGSDTQTLSSETALVSQSLVGSDTQTLVGETASIFPTIGANDSATQTEGAASLTAQGNATDTFTVTDDAYLLDMQTSASDSFTETAQPATVFAATIGSETHTLSAETSALTQGRTGTDTQTLSETAAIARTSVGTDSLTLTEAAGSITAEIAGTDTFTATESVLLDQGGVISAMDTFTVSETAEVTVDHASTDEFTVTDIGALAEFRQAGDSMTLGETLGSLTAAVTDTDEAELSEASSFEGGEFRTGSDTFIVGEVSSLTKVTEFAGVDSATLTESATLVITIEATDQATLIEEANAVVFVVAEDLHTLFEQASTGADSVYLLEQRRLTTAYIMENPVEIRLLPHARVRTHGGGYVTQAGSPRALQAFRLIETSSVVVTDPVKTTDGWMRTRMWQLMGEWDAEIQPDDTFEHDGRTWTVLSMMPENGYETRAQVERVGS